MGVNKHVAMQNWSIHYFVFSYFSLIRIFLKLYGWKTHFRELSGCNRGTGTDRQTDREPF